MMKRRQFITLLGGAAAAWPCVARAQQPAVPVIGFLHISTAGPARAAFVAFLNGLGEAGLIEGRNVAIEQRWAEFQADRLPALASDLARRQVAVIVAGGGNQAPWATKTATSTIPIVFVGADTPVESGLVASFNRPGGNITGVIFDNAALMAKRVELLHQLVPGAKTVALLVRPTERGGTGFAEAETIAAQAAATALGLQFHVVTASNEGEIDAAFATLARQRVEALVLATELFFNNRRDQIAALELRYRIPTSGYRRDIADAGGLVTYGASIPDGYRQAGVYAGRILKGEKPGDLPVQAPTKFEFVINLKTAKALGLIVSNQMQLLADEVIE
jgi:putative tryptophan/tyrosine transport system substrate-binding protein